MFEEIKKQAEQAVLELIELSGLKSGQILAVGCSSSEITGEKIGKGSVPEAAQAVFEGIYPILKERGIYLAAQCCEHLNRALAVEREAAERFGLEIVAAVPQVKAGGSFATAAYGGFDDPVLVEEISAHAGLDIGATLIGMHLKKVAVPVRLKVKQIGQAPVTAARTRPKFIGGARARYE